MTVQEIVTSWEHRKWPVALMRCEHNYLTLHAAIADHVRRTNRLTDEDIESTIQQLGDVQRGGRLIYIPIAADPANNLPHADDPQLNWLDSIEAINEASSEKIRRFIQPTAVDSGLHKRFNERVEHLRKYKIRRPKAEPRPEPAPLTPQQQAKQKACNMLAEIRALADGVKGYTAFAVSTRNRLHREINEKIAEGKSLEETRAYILNEIRNVELGSIR